jgi:hypothetical protein
VAHATYRHPLALSLLADVAGEGEAALDRSAWEQPDLVKRLTDHFLHTVPAPCTGRRSTPLPRRRW